MEHLLTNIPTSYDENSMIDINVFNNDTQTIISDITENSDDIFEDFQQPLNVIKDNLNIELNKLNSDTLKEKCKEYGIGPISKLKKNELVELLLNEFTKITQTLKTKNANDLKNICKILEIKGIHKHKKDRIIILILTHCSTNLIFKIENNVANVINIKSIKENKQSKAFDKSINIEEKETERFRLEEIAKEKEIERIRLEEIERIRLEEIERIRLEEIERIRLEEIAKEQLKLEKKEETKKKKQAIPKQIRNIVWNHYIGEDIIKHKCLSCKKVTISNVNFEVGHVISEKHGGTHEINNLRPICGACNHSMGTENMIDFVVKYGLYIG